MKTPFSGAAGAASKLPRWLVGYIVVGVIVTLALATYDYLSAERTGAAKPVFQFPTIWNVVMWPKQVFDWAAFKFKALEK